jgi:hypothetical protein
VEGPGRAAGMRGGSGVVIGRGAGTGRSGGGVGRASGRGAGGSTGGTCPRRGGGAAGSDRPGLGPGETDTELGFNGGSTRAELGDVIVPIAASSWPLSERSDGRATRSFRRAAI